MKIYDIVCDIRSQVAAESIDGANLHKIPEWGAQEWFLGQNNNFTLDDISAGPTKVFDGGQRTARARGSIMDHAVSFQSRYNLLGSPITGNNYDLSLGTGTLSAEIVYTVYTP